MDIYWSLFEVGINMFQCALMIYYGVSIFEARPQFSKPQYYLLPVWIIDSTILSLYLFLDMPKWLPNLFPSAAIFLIWTSIFRKEKFARKLLWCLIYYAGYVAGIGLIMGGILFMPKIVPELIEQRTIVRVVYVLTVNALHVFVTFLLIRIAKLSLRNLLHKKIMVVSCTLVAINLLLLLLLIEYASLVPPNVLSPVMLIISAVALIAVNLLVLWMFQYISAENDRKLKESAESHLRSLRIQAEDNYRRIDEDLRQFRHDNLSRMQYILSQLNIGAIPEAKAFLEKNITDLTTFERIHTGNEQMDYIVSGKAMQAKAKGVKLVAEMILSPSISIEETDLLLLMSNLLDNAIEASEYVSDPQKRVVEAQAIVANNNLIVKIQNHYIKRPGIKGMYSMTSKENGEWHGLGLHIVEKIIHQYCGQIEVKKKNSIYTVVFSIPLMS